MRFEILRLNSCSPRITMLWVSFYNKVLLLINKLIKPQICVKPVSLCSESIHHQNEEHLVPHMLQKSVLILVIFHFHCQISCVALGSPFVHWSLPP